VTRFGKISRFGLLLRPSNFFGETWYVVGILRV
jgi:hypothetical protein